MIDYVIKKVMIRSKQEWPVQAAVLKYSRAHGNVFVYMLQDEEVFLACGAFGLFMSRQRVRIAIYATMADRYRFGTSKSYITLDLTNNLLNKVQIIKNKNSKFTNYIS